jgi:hypothetical protein
MRQIEKCYRRKCFDAGLNNKIVCGRLGATVPREKGGGCCVVAFPLSSIEIVGVSSGRRNEWKRKGVIDWSD